MMVLNYLNESFLDKKKFKIKRVESDGIAILEETKQMKLTINNLPQNSIYIKLPMNQDGFFNKDSKNYTKICDYLIFVPISVNKKYALVYCELKKNLSIKEEENSKQQIKSTIPLVKYIMSGLEVHHELDISIKEHNVIIYENRGRLEKENLRITKNDLSEVEDGFILLRCSDAPISYKNLLN